MQVMLIRLMSKTEYLIMPKGTKFKGSGKLGLKGESALGAICPSLMKVSHDTSRFVFFLKPTEQFRIKYQYLFSICDALQQKVPYGPSYKLLVWY